MFSYQKTSSFINEVNVISSDEESDKPIDKEKVKNMANEIRYMFEKLRKHMEAQMRAGLRVRAPRLMDLDNLQNLSQDETVPKHNSAQISETT